MSSPLRFAVQRAVWYSIILTVPRLRQMPIFRERSYILFLIKHSSALLPECILLLVGIQEQKTIQNILLLHSHARCSLRQFLNGGQKITVKTEKNVKAWTLKQSYEYVLNTSAAGRFPNAEQQKLPWAAQYSTGNWIYLQFPTDHWGASFMGHKIWAEVGWERLVLCALLRHPSCSSCVGWLPMHWDCLLILPLYFLSCSVVDRPSPVFPGGIKGIYQTHSFRGVKELISHSITPWIVTFHFKAGLQVVQYCQNTLHFLAAFIIIVWLSSTDLRGRDIHDTTGVKWRRKYVERKRLKWSLN